MPSSELADLETGAACRGPGERVVGAGSVAGDHSLLRHHDSRVETYAELADQVGAVLGFGEAASRNDLVPDLAMVPRLSISSWRSMPMPVSTMSACSASLFGTMVMLGGWPSGISCGFGDRLRAQACRKRPAH